MSLPVSIERIEAVASIQVALVIRQQRISYEMRDELRQEARIKAWQCARTWRPDGGASYETYASRPIRLQLLQYLRGGKSADEEIEECGDGGRQHQQMEAAIQGDERRRLILGEVRALDPAQADLILSMYYRGCTLKGWQLARRKTYRQAISTHREALAALRSRQVLCAI